MTLSLQIAHANAQLMYKSKQIYKSPFLLPPSSILLFPLSLSQPPFTSPSLTPLPSQYFDESSNI